MQRVLIIHEVESCQAWKVVFDQATDIRKHAGEISYQLLRYDNDANTIVHFSEWSSLDNARRFFESSELVDIRKKAGVKSPDFIYLHEIEHGALSSSGNPELATVLKVISALGLQLHASPAVEAETAV